MLSELTTFVPLLIVVVALSMIVRYYRDCKIASKKFHEAYLEGFQKGSDLMRESVRADVERQALEGISELQRKYPLMVKVVENRAVGGRSQLQSITGGGDFWLPRVSFLIIVEPKNLRLPRVGELKANWEQML
jgi:hypothetical protein